MAFLIGNIVGGFLAVWVLQGVLQWAIFKRAVDDPIKSRLIATLCAYALASVLYALGRGSFVSLAFYFPGALLVAFLEYRGGVAAQVKAQKAEDLSRFD